jgi:hypothetical protein
VKGLRRAFLPLIVLLSAAPALATTIVIAKPTSASAEQTETLSRLHGELLSLGLGVAIVERPAAGDPREADLRGRLEGLAAEHRAEAVIDLGSDQARATVTIWVFDRQTRRSETFQVALDPSAENPAERLAIRSIEVLRSTLLEIDLAARGQRVTTPAREPPAAVAQIEVRPPARDADRVSVEAGVSVLTSFDGVGPALLPTARVGWAAGTWLVLQGAVAGLGSNPTVTAVAGSARVAQQYGVLGGCVCAPSKGAIRPYAALAAGVLRTSLDGQASAPEVAHFVARWSFLVDASVGARLNLAGRYHLTLAAHVHVAEPYIAIHIVDTLVATTGRPNFLFSLAVGAWL